MNLYQTICLKLFYCNFVENGENWVKIILNMKMLITDSLTSFTQSLCKFRSEMYTRLTSFMYSYKVFGVMHRKKLHKGFISI